MASAPVNPRLAPGHWKTPCSCYTYKVESYTGLFDEINAPVDGVSMDQRSSGSLKMHTCNRVNLGHISSEVSVFTFRSKGDSTGGRA